MPIFDTLHDSLLLQGDKSPDIDNVDEDVLEESWVTMLDPGKIKQQFEYAMSHNMPSCIAYTMLLHHSVGLSFCEKKKGWPKANFFFSPKKGFPDGKFSYG